MKKVLALAIAAALVSPVAAMADATIYGKVRQALEVVDNELTGADDIEINDYTSRLGVKGSEDLGNGLTAVYKIEYGVKISTPSQSNEFSGDGTLSARNAFVGLAGGFGTFVIGRHDTPLKLTTQSLDYFADTAVDNNANYTESVIDRRADGTVAYISPSLAGLTAAVALVPGENSEADGIADAYSLAAMYSNGGIYAALGYEAADGNIDAIGADGADLTQIRGGVGYDGGMFKVGFTYESVQIDDPAGGDLRDSASIMVNGGVQAGPGMVVAKYFDFSDDVSDTNDHDGFGLGYHYNLSKRTSVMANYVSSSFDNLDSDVSIFSLQLNHDF